MRRYITSNELYRLLDTLDIRRSKQRIHQLYSSGELESISAGRIKLYPIEAVERLVKELKKGDYIQEDYENALKFVISYSR